MFSFEVCVMPQQAFTSCTNFLESVNSESQTVTLAVLDRGYFLEYYGNRSVFDKARACDKMFKKVRLSQF